VEILLAAAAAEAVLLVDGRDLDALGRSTVHIANDDILRHVHEAPSEVPRVRRAERRVRQPLACTVGRDEVLEAVETLAEIRLHGQVLDQTPERIRHQTAHTGELTDLPVATTSAGVHHHRDRVEGVDVLPDGAHHVVRCPEPALQHELLALALGDVPAPELPVQIDDLRLGLGDELVAARLDVHVRTRDRDTRSGRVVEAQLLDIVQILHGPDRAMLVVESSDQPRQRLAVEQLVVQVHVDGRQAVDNETPNRGVDPVANDGEQEGGLGRHRPLLEGLGHGLLELLAQGLGTGGHHGRSARDGGQGGLEAGHVLDRLVAVIHVGLRLGLGPLGLLAGGDRVSRLLGRERDGGVIVGEVRPAPLEPTPVRLAAQRLEPVHQRHVGLALNVRFDLQPFDSDEGAAVHIPLPRLIRQQGLLGRREVPRRVPRCVLPAELRQVVAAQNDVIQRRDHGTSVRRLEQVPVRQHQDPRLSLRVSRQRDVHRHLVTVEVRVERLAYQWVDLDGLAIDKDRLERLDAETVQRRRPVQHDRMVLDHVLQCVPHLGLQPIHHALGRLDVGREPVLDQPLHHEGLEQLERHLARQSALVKLQLRTDHDDRPARVIDALPQQVLAETTVLALEQIAERFQRAPVRPGHRMGPAAVVDQGVDRLLQQALLVVDDRLGRLDVDDTAEPVVSVDDAPVEVVDIRGREAPAVELHHGPQLGRQHGHAVEDHPLRAVARLAEALDHRETLDGASPLRAAGGLLDLLAELAAELLEVDLGQEVADGLSAETSAHGTGVVLAQALREDLQEAHECPILELRDELLLLNAPEELERRVDLGQSLAKGLLLHRDAVLEVALKLGRVQRAIPEGVVALVDALIEVIDQVLVALVPLGLRRRCLSRGRLRARTRRQNGCGTPLGERLFGQRALLELLQLLELVHAPALEALQLLLAVLLGHTLGLLQALRDPAVVHMGHDVGREVNDLLERARRHVQQQADGGGDPLEIPDVADGSRQLDVAHAPTANLGPRNLNTAPIADDALELDLLVLTAVALPVSGRPEDALAEQPIALRLEGPVVDGLRLLHLALRPLADLLRRGQTDAKRVKGANMGQGVYPLSPAVPSPPPHRPFRTRGGGGGALLHRLVVGDDLLFGVVQLHLFAILTQDRDPQRQALELLDQDVERLRDTWLQDVLALDDGLVRLHTAHHVVRLDGQHLLERVGGAVGLECPHLHLAEPLAAELGLAAQRLLRHQRVRASRPCVNLVLNQVNQLQNVRQPHRDRLVEQIARHPVTEPHAPGPAQEPGTPFHQLLDLPDDRVDLPLHRVLARLDVLGRHDVGDGQKLLRRPLECRRPESPDDLLRVQRIGHDEGSLELVLDEAPKGSGTVAARHLLQILVDFLVDEPLENGTAEADAELLRDQPEMALKDLAHVES